MLAAVEAKKAATNAAFGKKGPAKKAPVKKAPEPIVRSGPPRRKAEEKPEKPKKSLFKKSKKKKAPKAQKTKTKKAPKPSGPKGESAFSKFAQHIKEEFKNATDEIKPKALLNHAQNGIKSIKGMVNRGEGDKELDEVSDDSGGPQTNEPERSQPTEGLSTEVRPEEVFEAHSVKSDGEDGAPVELSAAKVQRAPKKKVQEETQDDEIAATETSEGDDGEDKSSTFSTVKVDKIPSKKKPLEAEDEEQSEEPVGDEAEDESESTAEEESEEFAAEAKPTAETNGESKPRRRRKPSKKKPEEAEDGEQSEEPVGDEAEDEEQSEEPVGDEAEDESESTAEEESEELAAEAEPTAETDDESKPKKRKPSKTKMSKKDQAIRHFEALQTVLKNETWKSVITDPDSKPSSLFSPRDKFEENFADQTFREGLKAANRLAASFSFDPDSIDFSEKVIERVVAFEVDPEGKVQPDTDSPSKFIDEDHLKRLFGMIKDPQCKTLFYSVGTKLGEFVPTIEILARIYLPLRKQSDIIPGERLAICDDVLMRYKKSPYTEAKANTARNLALKYFTDFLAEYGLRLYKERFAETPDGQNNIEGQLRRHKVIKSSCFNMFEQRGTKIGLSQSAVINLKACFSKTADNYLKSQVAEIPDEVFEEMNKE
ncbi:MAG: hypothetical protein CME25_18145 [Gemmatimonadetes bacterium]|nr:hypothetical protein [Gemmatimonadota bacterium]